MIQKILYDIKDTIYYERYYMIQKILYDTKDII